MTEKNKTRKWCKNGKLYPIKSVKSRKVVEFSSKAVVACKRRQMN